MEAILLFICSIIVGSTCEVNLPSGELEEQVTLQELIEKPIIEEPVLFKHSKISQSSWDRAIGIRPLLRKLVADEFDGNELWLGVMVALCHTESRCNPKAKSPVGAFGEWQWMKRSFNAFLASDCRDLPRNNNYQDLRQDPVLSAYCAARHLKQNMRIVKVQGDDCSVIVIGALRGYNEGPGNTNKARRLSTDPNDINSVAAVSWKSKANELQTDQYGVKIMAKNFNYYKDSNYFNIGNPCSNYSFNLYGVTL